MLARFHGELGNWSGGGTSGKQNVFVPTVGPNLKYVLVIADFSGLELDWDRK